MESWAKLYLMPLDKSEKLHWEWEVFHYYLYWGIFLNSLVFSVMIYYLTKSQESWILIFILFIFNLGIFILGCYRSYILNSVYEKITDKHDSKYILTPYDLDRTST